MIQISSKTVFAVFGIFLYIAAGIALLAYLESTERTKKSDIISIIIYILFTAVFFFTAFVRLINCRNRYIIKK